jgi:RimJ/RimL family protein N-acetyltransferase
MGGGQSLSGDCPPVLRDVTEEDLPVFFEHQRDPEAVRMAVWPPRERDAFFEHWRGIMSDDDLIAKTIVSGDEVAGNIGSFERDGKRYVGYWLGREFWGQGLATKALAELVAELDRPIYAEVAATNVGSVRVLEKCGFELVGTVKEQHEAFGEVELLVMELVG